MRKQPFCYSKSKEDGHLFTIFCKFLLHQNTFSEGQNAFHCYITTRAPRVRNGLGSTFLCLAASGDHMSSKAALPCCVGNCLGHTSKQTSAQVQRSCGDLPPFGRHLASLSVQCSFHFHISKISPTYLCQCDTQEIHCPPPQFPPLESSSAPLRLRQWMERVLGPPSTHNQNRDP